MPPTLGWTKWDEIQQSCWYAKLWAGMGASSGSGYTHEIDKLAWARRHLPHLWVWAGDEIGFALCLRSPSLPPSDPVDVVLGSHRPLTHVSLGVFPVNVKCYGCCRYVFFQNNMSFFCNSFITHYFSSFLGNVSNFVFLIQFSMNSWILLFCKPEFMPCVRIWWA